MHVINDWRDEVSLSLWSDTQERLGEWSIRRGENVVLQERGGQIRVRPNDEMQVGDNSGWVEVGQVGQFQNGTWYVNMRDVWAATHPDRPEGRDTRRGEGTPKGEDSVVDQMLKRIK